MLISRTGPHQSSSVCWKFDLHPGKSATTIPQYHPEPVVPPNKPKLTEPIPLPIPKVEIKPGAKKIILISCVKSKLSHRAMAQNLYTSTLFRSNLSYARKLKPDAIYILSAKYGLVELDQEVDPYEMTLNTMGENQKKAWANQVLAVLKTKANLDSDHFIFLAGNNYRKYLLPHIRNFEIPLEGLSFGQQLSELKKRTL